MKVKKNMIKTQLIKRVQSFCWRALMLGIVVSIDYLLKNLGILEMPDVVTLILGGLLGEVSKWMNNKIQKSKEVRGGKLSL